MKRTPLQRKTRLKAKSTLRRSGSLKRSKMAKAKRAPKPRKVGIDSPAHREFVRGFPCAYCEMHSERQDSPTEAHHHRKGAHAGTGIKPCDSTCVPLCTQHHNEFHTRGCIGEWSPKQTHAVLIPRRAEVAELSRAAGILPQKEAA